jgi:oligopeptide transport system substrate-binding protein
VLGLVLAACDNGPSDQPNPPQSGVTPAAEQVLRLRIPGEPRTIDPHVADFASEASIAKMLFSGLFTYDENLGIVANVAAEVPTGENGGISADGLTYTVKLREGLTWSDGSPLTANDFVYSIKRALDPRLGGAYVSFYASIAGAADYFSALGTPDEPKQATDAELAALRDAVAVTAPDDTTVVYTLVQPNPSFLNILTLPAALPVKQSVIEQFGDSWTEAGNLIGNGPFVLQSWAHDQNLVFAANENWHADRAKLDQITVSIIADDAVAFQAYQAGELDVVTVPPPNRAEVLADGSAYADQVVRQPLLFTFAMMMNAAQAPFDNMVVRQAFGTAIDREAFVAGPLQGSGFATTSWLPPAMPGYDPEVGSQYSFDPDKAKALLAEAGYPNGEGLPPVKFILPAIDSYRVAGQFVQEQLAQNLGVQVEVEYLDPPVFGGQFGQNLHQAVLLGWSGDWPYPDSFLPELFGTGSPNNHVGFSSATFDALVAEAASEVDAERRLELYKQAHKVAMDQAALMPLYNRELTILVKPNVADFVVTAIDGGISGDYFLSQTFIAAE